MDAFKIWVINHKRSLKEYSTIIIRKNAMRERHREREIVDKTRTNYRHLLLLFVRLFLYHSVHPFKYPVILNVTLRLTFDGNILNFLMGICIFVYFEKEKIANGSTKDC
jgi:hypothetical protein